MNSSGNVYILFRLIESLSRPSKYLRRQDERKKPANTAFDIAFDSLYFQAKRKGLKDEEMVDYIQAGLMKL